MMLPCGRIRSTVRAGFVLAIALALGVLTLESGDGRGVIAEADAAGPPLDVHYVPTPHEVVDRMLEVAEAGPDDYVVDLGSGDGRIVIAAVRDWGVPRALGIDLDPQRVREARENARLAGVEDRVTFEQGDLFQKDFSDATVLTLYLLQSLNLRLKPIILERLAPGTRVVSHAFDMGDWKADRHDVVNGRNVYLWTVPAQVAGQWQVELPDGSSIALSLGQTYQELEGSASIDGAPAPLTDLSLHGDEISFSIGADRYAGKVNGDTIVPLDRHDAARNWHARRT